MTAVRGFDEGAKCLSCVAEEQRQRPTRIREFAANNEHSHLLVGLFELDERLRRSKQDGFIGLNLIDPPERESDIAPLNSIAFASTGGDDVTFSLLGNFAGGFDDSSRVVLTVPRAEGSVWARNFVVGESLHDFLCLGCFSGYATLEDLPYDWPGVVAELIDPHDAGDDPKAAATLLEMRRSLNLSPWNSIEPKLSQLQAGVRFLFRFSEEASLL